VRYALAVDLGTTYTAAAVAPAGDPDRAEVFTLGTVSPQIPSVVVLREDGTLLVGEAAERRALSEPERTAREFKRRLGDPVPLIIGRTPYGAEALMAHLLRAVVDAVTEQHGEPPADLTVTHPANYGEYKKDLLREMARLADVGEVHFVTEPEAAAIDYSSRARIDVGQVVAVYDFGGGTFDAAVLRRTDDGFELLGGAEGMERLGGVDFDQAIIAHVDEALGGALSGVDRADPEVRAGLARLRGEARLAKETLSSDTDATIAVALPGSHTQVRITRPEFEQMARPRIDETIAALGRAVRNAGLTMEDVTRIVLVGGSARIPVVAEMVSQATGRPTAVDAHPKFAIALGAARWGARRLAMTTKADSPPEEATAIAPADPAVAPVAVPAVSPVADPAVAHTAAPAAPPARRSNLPLLAALGVAALLVGGAALLLLFGGLAGPGGPNPSPTDAAGLSPAVPTSTSAAQTPPPPAPTEPATGPPATDPPATLPPAVESAFVEHVGDTGFRSLAAVSGTLTVAGRDYPITGETRFAGRDTRTDLSVQVPDGTQQTSGVTAGGRSYSKVGDGPWVLRREQSSSLTDALLAPGGYRDAGQEDRDGRTVHRLEPAGEVPSLVEPLGLDSPEIASAQASMTVYAEADGTPAFLVFDIAWRQLTGDAEVPASMRLEMAMSRPPAPISVEPPTNAWLVRHSESLRYEMAYPPTWTTSFYESADWFYSNDGVEVLVQRAPAPSDDLGAIVDRQVSDLAPQLGPPLISQPMLIATREAHLLGHDMETEGRPMFFMQALLLQAGDLVAIQWFSPAGAYEADRAQFEQMLATLWLLP
jgi:actin-like ATPase involved in cell morphogenesis